MWPKTILPPSLALLTQKLCVKVFRLLVVPTVLVNVASSCELEKLLNLKLLSITAEPNARSVEAGARFDANIAII